MASSPSRRALLAGGAALGGAALLPRLAFANGEPFDFDALTEDARRRAAGPYQPPQPAQSPVAAATYDDYRNIAYRPERAVWGDTDARFQMHAFHMGWLFEAPVPLFEVVDGIAQPLDFTSDDFEYRQSAARLAEPGGALPGVSGFRLHTPLNRPGVYDELIAFQGASYFRALGRGNAYGLSARGLAIDTATGRAEEFPHFSAFYAVRPAPGDEAITVYASLDGPSVAGAYAFVITPGQETSTEIEARLFFRQDVQQLGVAPLTSMFLYDESAPARFDDYRPQVHDSNGLLIRRAGGERLWRALANPPRLATSYFAETSPTGFGLHQRDRDFAAYQDAEAQYHLRPSAAVEAIGDWGRGAVKLVEIPTDLEVNDNIVTYWVPGEPIREGSAHSWRYRLRWGMLEPDSDGALAYVAATRGGEGGVSGVANDGQARKFVVDFAGGRLPALEPDAEIEAFVSVMRGRLRDQVLSKIDGGMWRLVIDAEPEPGAAMELVASLGAHGERLSETWLYQWMDQR